MKKKKIFIVCGRLSYGGAERVAVVLANGFAQRGHDVTVVANLYDDKTYKLDARIRQLNLVPTNDNKLKKWGGAPFLLRRHLKKHCPDVIIGIMWTCSFVSYVASLGLHIPVIATEHDSFERPASAPFTALDKFSKFVLNKIYRCVTVLTEADKKVIGNRIKNVVVMPNPLSTVPTDSIEGKQKQLIAAGRLESWHVKGFDILIKAWGKIASAYPEWILKIAGYGTPQEIANIENMMQENDVSNRVELLGFRNDIQDIFRQSEVFVLSSRYEGFGLVLIEAMSQGCACVACDYKGRQSEIITNASVGVVCAPEDVDALAEAMKHVLDDGDNRKRMQQNAIERSKYYLLDPTIDRWESLLNNVLNNNTSN